MLDVVPVNAEVDPSSADGLETTELPRVLEFLPGAVELNTGLWKVASGLVGAKVEISSVLTPNEGQALLGNAAPVG